MLQKIHRFWTMPGTERAATVQIALLIPVITVSLAVIGFRQTASWVRWIASRSDHRAIEEATFVKTTVTALRRVRSYTPWTGRCLARALSLWLVLRRRGVNAELHLGVRRAGSALDAHAWVEHKGQVLADSDAVWTEFPGRFASTVDLDFKRDR